MKKTRLKLPGLLVLSALALLVLSLTACDPVTAGTPAAAAGDPIADPLVLGADNDGAVSADFIDATVDAAAIPGGILTAAGEYEAKDAGNAYAGISASTLSIVAAGSDKLLKLDLDLTGAAKSFETGYNLVTLTDLSAGGVWKFRLFMPPAMRADGLASYPILKLFLKNHPNPTTWNDVFITDAGLNVYTDLVSGWNTLSFNFSTGVLTINGTAKAPVATVHSYALSAEVALGADFFKTAFILGLAFSGTNVPASAYAPMYLDYIDLSGGVATVEVPAFATASVAAVTDTITLTGPAGADIYYTLDGSTPTSAKTKYTAAFAPLQGLSAPATVTVKAVAVKGGNSSAVVSKVYSVGGSTDSATWSTFESDADGWKGNFTYYSATGSVANDATGFSQNTNAAYVKNGVGSLKVDFAFNTVGGWDAPGKAFAGKFINPSTFNAKDKTLTFNIYVPASMNGFKAELVVKDSAWNDIGQTGWPTTLATGWNTLTMPAASTSAAAWSAIYAVGIEIAAGAASTASGSFYIDSVDFQ